MPLFKATPVPKTSAARTYREIEYDMSWDTGISGALSDFRKEYMESRKPTYLRQASVRGLALLLTSRH
jgi:hypothetical protein